tara:strand:- start:67 stop:402 length:336 start_codon:yes stop_codon:yes gene_type:complete
MTNNDDPDVFNYRSELVTFAVRLHENLATVKKGSENEKDLLLEIAEESKSKIKQIIKDEPQYMIPHLTQIAETWSDYMDKAVSILSRKNPKILDARTYLGGPEREEFRARR